MFFSKRRKFSNILISPETQIRYGVAFLALSIVANVVFTVIGTNIYYAWLNDNVDESKTLPMAVLLVSCVIVYILIYAFSFVLGLILSHRVLGPVVPIQRMISEMKAGDFRGRVKLREKDEPRMQEIAASLNELAEYLEKKSGK